MTLPHSATSTLLSSPRVCLLISTHAEGRQGLVNHNALQRNLSKNPVLSSLKQHYYRFKCCYRLKNCVKFYQYWQTLVCRVLSIFAKYEPTQIGSLIKLNLFVTRLGWCFKYQNPLMTFMSSSFIWHIVSMTISCTFLRAEGLK